MQYWLMKSEPDVWSIDQQIKAGEKGADWDGVRNYQAASNLKKMEKGDLCFFYHSNIGKEIVGIVKVVKEAFIDPTDNLKRFVAIKVCFKNYLDNPVTLESIKKNKNLESELESLTYDEDALEGYARQELGLIKEGEIIIEIEND